jgi:hypothetical protein
MHRTLACATLGLVLIAAGSAEAAAPKPPKKTKRDVTFDYDHPCSLSLQSPVVAGPGASLCPTDQNVTTKTGETYITVSATDKTGQPVAFTFQEDNGATQNNNPVILVCGSMKNIKVHRAQYDIHPAGALASVDCPAPATTGTIKMTVSNYKL